MMVDFLAAVNAVIPFNPVGHQGVPQLFPSSALLPQLRKLQEVFRVSGDVTNRSTLQSLRQRIRFQTSRLVWNAPLGGSISTRNGGVTSFRYDGPTLTWKQFWRAVECLLEDREGFLMRVEYDVEDQHLELITTADITVVQEPSRAEKLVRTIRLFSTPPWDMSQEQFRLLCDVVGLRSETLDLTDRQLISRHIVLYLERQYIEFRDHEWVMVDGFQIALPVRCSLRDLISHLISNGADLASGRAEGSTVNFNRRDESEYSSDNEELVTITEESENEPDSARSEQSEPDSTCGTDISLVDWNGPPLLRDDVIATGRVIESLLPFFNPRYREGMNNALRPPNEVSTAAKEEVQRQLGGNVSLQQIAEEIARRLRAPLPLEREASLVVQRDSQVVTILLEEKTTCLRALSCVFSDGQGYNGHTVSFNGDEIRFTLQ